MGFEIFNRGLTRGMDMMFISISKTGKIALNKGATAIFKKMQSEFALLMWDKETGTIGIKPTTEMVQGVYKIRNTKSGRCDFSAVPFFRYIGYDFSVTHAYEIRWEEGEGMFTAALKSAGEKEGGVG